MSDFTFAVYRDTSPGASTGKTDAFLNLARGGETLSFSMQDEQNEGWIFKALKFYWVQPNDIKTQKRADTGSMNSGQTRQFTGVFGTPPAQGTTVTDPDSGASYVVAVNGGNLTITNSSNEGQALEFLIWIQNTAGTNDWVDPGIRNDF